MLQGLDGLLELGFLEIVPQAVVNLVFVQYIRIQGLNDLADIPFPQFHLFGYNEVAQTDAFAEQGFGEVFQHQSVRVFGIKQEGLQFFGFPTEVVHQDALVQHHLDEMVFFVLTLPFIAFP